MNRVIKGQFCKGIIGKWPSHGHFPIIYLQNFNDKIFWEPQHDSQCCIQIRVIMRCIIKGQCCYVAFCIEKEIVFLLISIYWNNHIFYLFTLRVVKLMFAPIWMQKESLELWKLIIWHRYFQWKILCHKKWYTHRLLIAFSCECNLKAIFCYIFIS